jgi:PAS domain S-box-containing protein
VNDEFVDDLRRQVDLFEPVLKISPTAFVVTDPETAVVAWNPAAERLFGYSSDEAIGHNLDDLVASTDELHTEAVAIGERVAEGTGNVKTITRRTRKDGRLVDVEVLAAPLRVDGRIVGTLASYHDITDINRQRRFFEAMLEASPEAIVTLNLHDRVTSWNPSAERLFGYTAEQAVGRDINDLVATRPELRAEGKEIDRLADHGQMVRRLTKRTRKDGSLIDVDIVGGPITIGDEVVAKHAFYHDVSELQEQKRYFESLLEISPTAIAITDLAGTVLSWNPSAETLFGFSAAEAVGRRLDDLVAARPELREEAKRNTAAAARGKRAQATTTRSRKDGSLVDVQMISAPVVMNDERVGVLVSYHDITEVQQQRRWFESVLRLSPTAIITVDDETNVTSWNPAAERLFGYTAEEAMGATLEDLVANRPEIREEADRYSVAKLAGKDVRLITRRTRKDGSLVDVELLITPVLIGGEPVGHSVIYHDIGEIQRQRRYYEALVQANPVAIVLMDTSGTVTSWNPAAERLFGYTQDEAIGRDIDDLVATDERVLAEAASMTERGMSGELVHAITKRTRKDGSLVDVEVFGAPVIVSGEAVGLYGLYHDIGELQRAREQAESATEAKSAFLATMSHEIRTPLNAVIGMTGLLLDTELTAEQRHFAEVIRGSGDALLGVISNILDFSKIEAGRLELEAAPFDLRACVESALELVAPLAVEKGLDLAYDPGPDAPRGIVGDLTRLRQILINLTNNAVKFTNEGEVVVTVDARSAGSPRRHRLSFAIRDTGIGILDDQMDRLFESFSQVDPSTTRRYGGTGLGLAISRRLVELMGGSMSAESVPGTGSTFRFTIDAESADVPPAPFDVPGDILRGLRVLVVDDNATNRSIVTRQVANWAMDARDTGSPAEALAWIRAGEPFDVAVIDMQMPEMDGATLGREIRAVGAELPLVMLTSLGRMPDASTSIFAATLTKPIKPSQLFEALTGIFGGRADGDDASTIAVGDADEHFAENVPLRILVVEDNEVNRQLALLLLQKLGYRADVAANGIEAVEAVDRQSYDAVLMDVEMPEMDGLEAARRIRQMEPPTRPWIVAVTANALHGERDRCLQAGMDDYITKPLHLDALVAALRGAPPPPNGRRSDEAVDREVLRRLSSSLGEGGDASVRELIDTFRSQASGIPSTLRIAIDRRDSEEVRRAAHTLKSNASMFGASTLAELSRELESAARADELEGRRQLIDRIAEELHRALVELERVQAELRA